MKCKHEQHEAQVNVFFMEDTGRWQADITIKCHQCGLPFEFYGVDAGLDFNKPTMSIDAQELRVPIVPHGEKPTPLDIIGYKIQGLSS